MEDSVQQRGLNSEALRVVHTINSLRSDHGGPSRSVTALCAALTHQGTRVQIVTHEPGIGEGDPVAPDAPVTVHLAERQASFRTFLPGTTCFEDALTGAVDHETVIHDHGLWLPSNHAASQVSYRAGTPLIISLRGMASAWALRFNGLKKRAAWHLYQRRDVQRASALHATSEAEVEDIRRAGLRQPVALIPNGVTMPERRASQTKRSERTVLFLSRLHPVKGLDNLVQAWAQVRPAGWRLVLAGPDAGGHRAEIEQAARDLGLADEVTFTGAVSDEEKWTLYHEADLFVLPSFSENFGIVIAEALAAGRPVITTTATPWQDIEAHQCGWWIETGTEPLARALAEATSLSDEQRCAMGARGRTLIEQSYSWTHIAEEMNAVYAWLLRRGDRPECVVL